MKLIKKISIIMTACVLLVLGYIFLFKKNTKQIQRIVIVTVDTLRADHLGSFGYPINTTPFLDQIAKQGISFTNAFAATSSTVPSHASLFTSLHPLQHGVLKNGHKLSNQFSTMAEHFQKMGFITAGIASTDRHFHSSNLHRGFSYYNEPSDLIRYKLSPRSLRELSDHGIPAKTLEKLEPVTQKSYSDKNNFIKTIESLIGKEHTEKYKTIFVRYTRHDRRYRTAKDTVNNAIDWLKSVPRQKKIFLWIHLFDPHWPLRPPKAQVKLIKSMAERTDLTDFLLSRHHIEFSHFNNDEAKMLKIMREYDAEIHFVDSQLRRFFDFCQNCGFNEHSLWVITADHGQGLGNHNWLKHGIFVYNEQIRVPLIFHKPSEPAEGKAVHDVVEHVDVFPTLCDLLGTTPPPRSSGESLMPFISNDPNRTYRKKYAFSQRRSYDLRHSFPNIGDRPEAICEKGEKYTLQSKQYKYIMCTGGLEEFFNLHNDPYETHNLSGQSIPEKHHLKNILAEMLDGMIKESPPATLPVDQKTIEKLKSMGYLE